MKNLIPTYHILRDSMKSSRTRPKQSRAGGFQDQSNQSINQLNESLGWLGVGGRVALRRAHPHQPELCRAQQTTRSPDLRKDPASLPRRLVCVIHRLPQTSLLLGALLSFFLRCGRWATSETSDTCLSGRTETLREPRGRAPVARPRTRAR